MSNDRLSDMLSSIKNAAMAGKSYVEVLHSKECEAVAKSLEKAGFLSGVKAFKPEGKSYKMLHIDLAYDRDIAKVTDVKIVSKPGRRVYQGYQKLRPMAGGFGVRVVSTNRGVMNSVEARKKKLGGEVICEVM